MFKSQTLMKQQQVIEQLTAENAATEARCADLETQNRLLREQLEVTDRELDAARQAETEGEEALAEVQRRYAEEQELLSDAKAGLEHRYEQLLKLFARFRSVVRKAPAEVQKADAEEFAAMGETLDTLQERLDAFSDSVSMIKRIADQLELLGVNATIQAAHAGEKGKGFLIVADEINKLSAHSKRSVEEALVQLKLFTERSEALSRDFDAAAESVEGNLGVFRELDTLLREQTPQEIKETSETTDRM
jgi:heam-based aerotactic trancducer